MKLIYIVAALFVFLRPLQAQEKFIGIIEYDMKNVEKEKEDERPLKMTIIHSADKMLLKLHFADKTMEQWILVNTVNDSLYRVTPGVRAYIAESLTSSNEPYPQLVRTDSVKSFLGYSCRGYRLMDEDNKPEGYAWITESMLGIAKEYPNNPSLNILGGKYVMLGMDGIEDGERVVGIVPVSVTKMDKLPDSVFDISGYSEAMPPFVKPYDDVMADTAVAAPVKRPIKKKPVKKAPAKKPAPKKPAVKTKAAATKPKSY